MHDILALVLLVWGLNLQLRVVVFFAVKRGEPLVRDSLGSSNQDFEAGPGYY